MGDLMLSVNLNGYISLLDPNAPDKPKKVVHGHNKAVTTLAIDVENNRLFSGDSEAQLIRWNVDNGETALMAGKGHTNQVNRARVQGGHVVTAGKDDSIRFSNKNDMQWGANSVPLEGNPVDLAVGKKDHSVVVTITRETVVLLKDQKLAQTIKPGYEPTAVALSHDDTKVAVGDSKGVVRVYNVSGLSEASIKYEGLTGAVTAADYSPNGQWFAAADANRAILVWDAKSGGAAKIDGLKYHSSKPVSLSWAASSLHFVSAGLDGSIFVWSVEKPENRIHVKDAHKGGISEAVWVNPTTVASVGIDACIKTWTVKFH